MLNFVINNETTKRLNSLPFLITNPSEEEMSVMTKSIVPKPGRICQEEGCIGEHVAKGYCNRHYKEYRRQGYVIPDCEKNVCKVEGCVRRTCGNGYCLRHYTQDRKYGKIFGNPARGMRDTNEAVFNGNICEITLYNSHGYAKGKTIIDSEDYEKVKGFKWRMLVHPNGNTYATSKVAKRNYVYLHRVVLPSYNMVDHINHDGLDNRKENLRGCTKSENACNTGVTRGNASGFKGVSFSKDRNKWRAQIGKNNKNYHIGDFLSKEEAVKAYNEKALELHGEFAFQNEV